MPDRRAYYFALAADSVLSPQQARRYERDRFYRAAHSRPNGNVAEDGTEDRVGFKEKDRAKDRPRLSDCDRGDAVSSGKFSVTRSLSGGVLDRREYRAARDVTVRTAAMPAVRLPHSSNTSWADLFDDAASRNTHGASKWRKAVPHAENTNTDDAPPSLLPAWVERGFKRDVDQSDFRSTQLHLSISLTRRPAWTPGTGRPSCRARAPSTCEPHSKLFCVQFTGPTEVAAQRVQLALGSVRHKRGWVRSPVPS